MILNKSNNAVTITNFCLGKHLINDDDLLKDQRGSPAYISPEVLSGKYAVSHRWEFVFAEVSFYPFALEFIWPLWKFASTDLKIQVGQILKLRELARLLNLLPFDTFNFEEKYICRPAL